MRRHTRETIATALAALVIAGCSSQQSSAGTVPARELRVGLSEYDVVVSHAAAMPGDLSLTITNAGAEAHDLRVDGGQVPAATAAIPPGKTTTLQVQVSPDQDELVLWCTVRGHRSQGMLTRLAVSPDGGGNEG